MKSKELLRKKYLELRRKLDSVVIARQSKIITEKVLKFIEDHHYRSIHIYSDCRDGEVDTNYILKALSKKPVSISTCVFSQKIFDNKVIQGESLQSFECIIVPGIVFDHCGYRVGYGAGFYDRFLTQHSEAFTIGIAYDWQLIPHISSEDYDIPVSVLFTDISAVNCSELRQENNQKVLK